MSKLSLSKLSLSLCRYLYFFFRFISENLGGYIGASLGGFTFDKIGFVNGTTVVIGMQVRPLVITFLGGTFIALIRIQIPTPPFSDSLSEQILSESVWLPRPQCRIVGVDIQNWKCRSRVSFYETGEQANKELKDQRARRFFLRVIWSSS